MEDQELKKLTFLARYSRLDYKTGFPPDTRLSKTMEINCDTKEGQCSVKSYLERRVVLLNTIVLKSVFKLSS